MKALLFLILLCLVFPGLLPAQQADYEYSWATRGGGPRDLASGIVIPGLNRTQKVTAIAIDEDNNYYFLCIIGSESGSIPATFGDVLDPDNLVQIDTYNDPAGSQSYYARDTYLVSTTCEGEFRWHKTIGGGGNIVAHGLGTDDDGGVYVAGNHLQYLAETPVHFDQDTIKDSSTESKRKGIYLIKYDTEGNYQWLKEPRLPTDTDEGNDVVSGGEIYIDLNGEIHWLVVLPPGYTLEGGAVEAESVAFPNSDVPPDTNVGDVGVLRYDASGTFLGYTRLDIDMHGHINHNFATEIPFAYDPILERYYISAYRINSAFYHPAIIDGVEVTGQFYMAAFTAGNGDLLWWHELNNSGGSWPRLRDIDTDDSGNVYITGAFSGDIGDGDYDSFAGFTFENFSSEPFVMKLDSDGEVVWASWPDEADAGGEAMVLTDDEVVLGQPGYFVYEGANWDGLETQYERDNGHGADPMVFRLGQDDGTATAIHDIMGAGFGDTDFISALAVDKLGNIVFGGGMVSPSIFMDHPQVDEVWRESSSRTDFFIGQLAKAGVSCDDEWMGVEEEEGTSIRLYPNPADGELHWESQSPLQHITIYDMYGREVQAQTLSGTSGTVVTEGLATGSYIVVLHKETGEKTQQVLLVK